MQLNYIDQQLIQLALEEDLGTPFLDITSQTLFKEFSQGQVKIVSKHPTPIVFCGFSLVSAVLDKFNQPYNVKTFFKEGDIVPPKSTLLTIVGDKACLMMAERTILNFLQHLCAVATLTYQFVSLVSHTAMKILDTRKTLPGFRHLDKYAVQCGGGVNHRMGLYDALMLKDNHIDLLGGMKKALEKLPADILKHYPVIVEIRDLAELKIALQYGKHKITRVLLDNMSLTDVKTCVEYCKGIIPTEASGNMNLNTITAVAETGVDYASVGIITHSAGRVDLSMQMDL
jgi:nicotinate-nucleotide pyrophosphorylase (carboxylating)